MKLYQFLKTDYRRWIFPLRSSLIFIKHGESEIRNFVMGEVLNSKDRSTAFLPCPKAFALKDSVHLRHTLILDLISDNFEFAGDAGKIKKYKGGWQVSDIRDIDPSFLSQKIPQQHWDSAKHTWWITC